MSKVRSSRGVIVDFDLMAIKAQLAAKPKRRGVIERENYVQRKNNRSVAKSPVVDDVKEPKLDGIKPKKTIKKRTIKK